MSFRLSEIERFNPIANPGWVQPLLKFFGKGYKHPSAAFFQILASLNRKPLRWLDVGAGTNWLINVFNENHSGDIAIGIDLTIPVGLKNKKRYIVANAFELPFPSNTFDIVTAYWVVEHIPFPERFLMEIHRVLVPKGYFLLRTTNPLSPFVQVSRFLPQNLKKRLLRRFTTSNHIFHKTYDSLNHPKTLRTLPRRYGFKLVTEKFLESIMLFNPLSAIVSILYWQLTRIFPYLRTDIIALYQKSYRPVER